MKVTEIENGKLYVEACHSHYGHRLQLQHVLLSKRQHRTIAAKIQQGISREKILADIRGDIISLQSKLHLIDKKDISNIKRSFNLNKAQRHPNDQDSVAAWIWEWEGQPYNPVLFHKLQGQKADVFEDEDFIIVLQTEFQQQMFQQFGDKGICVDTTRGTNMYDFLLITMMVVDEFGEGQPVGWCLANHENFSFLRVFFQKIMENTGQTFPQWLMSDLASQFYEAFCATSESSPFLYMARRQSMERGASEEDAKSSGGSRGNHFFDCFLSISGFENSLT